MAVWLRWQLLTGMLLTTMCPEGRAYPSKVIIVESGEARMGRSDPDFPSADTPNHVGNLGDEVVVSIEIIWYWIFASGGILYLFSDIANIIIYVSK